MKEVKTHEIDGVTYVEVDREAKVGDIAIKGSIVRTVTKINHEDDCVEFEPYDEDGWCICGWGNDYYKILEPVEESPSVVSMLANLARRVTQLESQLSDTQRNAEWLAEELMALKYLTQSNEGDIRELDSRTQVLGAINKYYAEGRR